MPGSCSKRVSWVKLEGAGQVAGSMLRMRLLVFDHNRENISGSDRPPIRSEKISQTQLVLEIRRISSFINNTGVCTAAVHAG